MKCKNCGEEMRIAEFKEEEYYVCDRCRLKKKIVEPIDYYDEPASYTRPIPNPEKRTEKKKMSICLLISFIIGLAYMIYSFKYWGGANSNVADASEALGAGIATALVTPHLVCTFIAVVFNALGLFLKKRAFALVGAILYTVAMVMMPIYFFYVILEMILSYVGYAKMKK